MDELSDCDYSLIHQQNTISIPCNTIVDVRRNLDTIESQDHRQSNVEDSRSGSTSKWTIPETFGDPPSPRCDHSAVVHHPSNKMYIYGGANESERLEDLHILDLNTFSWSSPSTTGEHPKRLSIHTACVYENSMYLYGGSDGIDRRSGIFRLDLDTMAWEKISTLGSSPLSLNSHKSVVVNGKWFIFGGSLGPGKSSGALQVFDFQTRIWTFPSTSGICPAPRYAHAMSLVGNQFIVIAGGKSSTHRFGDVHVLDALNMRWMHCHPQGMLHGETSLLAPITSRISTIDSVNTAGLASFASSNASVCSTGSTSSSSSSQRSSPLGFVDLSRRKRAHSVDADTDDRHLDTEMDDNPCLNPVSHLEAVSFDSGLILCGGKHKRMSSDAKLETQLIHLPDQLVAASQTVLKSRNPQCRQGSQVVLTLDRSTSFTEEILRDIEVQIDCSMDLQDDVSLVDSLDAETAQIGFNSELSRHECTFVPLHTGTYRVTVKIGDFHVGGSPFQINVWPKLTSAMQLVENGLLIAPTAQQQINNDDETTESVGNIVSHCQEVINRFGAKEFDEPIVDRLDVLRNTDSLSRVSLPSFVGLHHQIEQNLSSFKIFEAASPSNWKALTQKYGESHKVLEKLESERACAFDERKKARKVVSASSVEIIRESQRTMIELDKRSIAVAQERQKSLDNVRKAMFRRFSEDPSDLRGFFEQKENECHRGFQDHVRQIQTVERKIDADIDRLGKNVKELVKEQTELGLDHQRDVQSQQKTIHDLDEQAESLRKELKRIERTKKELENDLKRKEQANKELMMEYGWAQLHARQWRKSLVQLKSLHMHANQAVGELSQVLPEALSLLKNRVISTTNKLNRMENGVRDEILSGCQQLHVELEKETQRLLAIDAMLRKDCTSLETRAQLELQLVQQELFAETQNHLESKQKALESNSQHLEDILHLMQEVEETINHEKKEDEDIGSWIVVENLSDSFRTTWTEGSFSASSSGESSIASSSRSVQKSDVKIKAHSGAWNIKLVCQRDLCFDSVHQMLMDRFKRAGMEMDQELVEISYTDADGDHSMIFDDDSWQIAVDEIDGWMEVEIVPRKKATTG
eukprot:TRINITY_DN367_c0_g1_i4.p1 TRINITY_DN367_c0_g1~~TRINITY_DN367_c0_g1_i4.p1  ORF type:complete len:1091 (+),score=281.67 TRINITY_DN367_c0_g1_i4:541-3813(+)